MNHSFQLIIKLQILMEQVRVIHNCVLFKIQETRYLYGLTYSYVFSTKLNKYKPHYLIVPSHPYTNQIFVHFGLDQLLNHFQLNHQSNQKDNYFYQFIKSLKGIILCSGSILSQYRYPKSGQLSIPIIQLGSDLEQHNYIQEKQLINVHCQQAKSQMWSKKEAKQAPFEITKWIGQPVAELKLIVNKHGNSIFFCLGMQMILIDPSEQIFHLLQVPVLNQRQTIFGSESSDKFTGMKLAQLLNTVIITRLTSVTSLLGILRLRFSKNVHKTIKVIVLNQQMQNLIIHTASRFLHFNEHIIRERLWIRILQPEYRFPLLITNRAYKDQVGGELVNNSTTNLMVHYTVGNQLNYPHLTIQFGALINVHLNKRVCIYGISQKCCKGHLSDINLSQQYENLVFNQLPKNLQKLDYLIVFRINQQLEKVMKSLPILLRKKIIYNRIQNKYNHKYFVTFSDVMENKIEAIKKSDIELMTGPKYSKKFQTGTKGTLKDEKQIVDFFVNENLSEYQIFQDLTWFADYVTIFNNHSNLLEKNSNLSKRNPDKVQEDRVYFGQIYQPDYSCIEISHNFCGGVCIDRKWKVRVIEQYQKINLKCSVIYLIDGMGLLVTQTSQSKKVQIRLIVKNQMHILENDEEESLFVLIGIKQCMIGVRQYSNFISHDPKFMRTSQETSNMLSDVNNSFLGSNNISRYQLSILNTIGKKQTYEVGSKINYNKNEKVFFVSKGALKWNHTETMAGSGYFIGDLLTYYSQSQQQTEKYIEVIKDTWVVEYNINQFDFQYLRFFPHQLSYIFDNKQIFN